MVEQLLLEATHPSNTETALTSSEQKVLSRLDSLEASSTGIGRRDPTLLVDVLRIAVEFLSATDSEKIFAKPVRTTAALCTTSTMLIPSLLHRCPRSSVRDTRP